MSITSDARSAMRPAAGGMTGRGVGESLSRLRCVRERMYNSTTQHPQYRVDIDARITVVAKAYGNRLIGSRPQLMPLDKPMRDRPARHPAQNQTERGAGNADFHRVRDAVLLDKNIGPRNRSAMASAQRH